MEEPFDLAIYYKDVKLYFTAGFRRPARFRVQVVVVVNAVELAFEPDNEGHYKAVVDEEFPDNHFPDPGLIEVISQRLDYLFKPGQREKLNQI